MADVTVTGSWYHADAGVAKDVPQTCAVTVKTTDKSLLVATGGRLTAGTTTPDVVFGASGLGGTWTLLGQLRDQQGINQLSLWKVLNPTVGAGTISATYDRTLQGGFIMAVGLSDAAPLIDFAAAEVGATDSANAAVTVNNTHIGSKGLVFGVSRLADFDTLSAGLTQVMDITTTTAVTSGTGQAVYGLVAQKSAYTTATGPTTMSATLGGDREWLMLGVTVFGSVTSSGGTTTPTTPAPVETTGSASALVNRWVGGVTSTGGKVKVKTTGVASVQIKVSTDPDLNTSPVYSTAVAPDSTGVSTHTVTGLQPKTTYYYGVVADGALIKDGGKIRTFGTGAQSFTFAFSSCQNDPVSSAWPRILARNPDLFVHMGDFWYDDGSTKSLAAYQAHYDAKFASDAGLANVFRSVPSAYSWSDHDFGMANNAVGTTSSGKPFAQAAYEQKVPYWNRPDTSGGAIYQSFMVGRVLFILTDDRSYKSANDAADNSSKTVLGSVQKQWFKDLITNTSAALIVWGSEQPWIGSGTSNDDDWFAYDTERQELGAFFKASGKNIAVVSGDMHGLAYDDGSNSAGNVVVMHAAALNNSSSIKGGPYSGGTYPTGSGVQVQQYATCTVTDTGGTSLSITYTGYDSSDVARISKTKTYTVAAASGGGTVTGGGTTGGGTTDPGAGTGGTTTGGTGVPVTLVAGTPVSTSAADATSVAVAVPAISSTEISVLAVASTSASDEVATPSGYVPLSAAVEAGGDTNVVSFYRKGPAAAATVTVTSGEPATSTSGGSTSTSAASDGLFISHARLMSLPTSGAEWDKMVSAANGSLVAAVDFTDNNDNHDTAILAAALVGVRTGNTALQNKAKSALDACPGSYASKHKRVLEMSRSIPSLIFACDVMGYKPAALVSFFESLRANSLQGHDGTGMLTTALNASNNWGSMSRAAMCAIDLWLGTHNADLQKVAKTYRVWLGETVAGFSDTLVWTPDKEGGDWGVGNVGINRRGAKIDGHNVDGVQKEDQRRTGGYKYDAGTLAKEKANGWPAHQGTYPWESLQGAIMTSLLLDRAGIVPFNAGDYAIQRAVTWLSGENDNAASGDDLSTPWLVNFYGGTFKTTTPTSVGKNNAWGAWLWNGKATNESGSAGSGSSGTVTIPAVPARITVVPFKLVGANMTKPFPVVPVGAAQASGTTATAASVTAPGIGTLVSLFGLRGTATGAAPAVSPPTGMTELAEKSSTVSGVTNNTVEVASVVLTAAGATGTKSATASAAGPSVGVNVYVAPAVGVTPGGGGSATGALVNAQSLGGLTHFYELDSTNTVKDMIGGLFAANHGATFSAAGATFNGSSYIEIPDSSDLSVSSQATGELTICAFMAPSSWTADNRGPSGFCDWLGKGYAAGSAGNYEYALRHYFSPDTSGASISRTKRVAAQAFSRSGSPSVWAYYQDDDAVGVENFVVATLDTNTTARPIPTTETTSPAAATTDWSTAYPGMVQLWKNGVLRASTGFEALAAHLVQANGNAPLRIGTSDGTSFFKGTIRRLMIFNRKLSKAEIATLYADRAVASGPTQSDGPDPVSDPGGGGGGTSTGSGFAAYLQAIPGLVAYYPLNEATTGTNVLDDDDDGSAADITGEVAFTPAGAVFDGTNYLTIPDADEWSIATTGALTVLAFEAVSDWSEGGRAESGGWATWLGKGSDSSHREWLFRHYFSPTLSGPSGYEKRVGGDVFSPVSSNSGGSSTYFQDDDPIGQENVVAMTMDTTTTSGVTGAGTNAPGAARLYKNGVLRDSVGFVSGGGGTNVRPANTESPVRIGAGPLMPAPASYYKGTIRRVAVFSRALTTAEIKGIYDNRDLAEGIVASGGGGSVVTAPLPPATVAALRSSDDASKATVSWTPPTSDGGSVITSYAISWTGGNTSGTLQPQLATARSLAVTGLPAAAVTFAVRAVNSVGASGASSAVMAAYSSLPMVGALSDNFDGAVSALRVFSPGVSQVNGELEWATVDATRRGTYIRGNMSEQAYFTEVGVDTTANVVTCLFVRSTASPSRQLRITHLNGILTARFDDGTADSSPGSKVYSATSDRYWRVVCANGQVLMQTSAGAASWTTIGGARTAPTWLTDVQVGHEVYAATTVA